MITENNTKRLELLSKAVTNNLNGSEGGPIPAWDKPKNQDAIAFLNSRFTLEERLAKFREETLEAALEVTRELDRPGNMEHFGLRGETLAEIADVVVTLDSLLSRLDLNPHLLAAVNRAYARLRGRIANGEFGPPPET